MKQHEDERAEAIRRVFATNGGTMTMRRLAQACSDEGISPAPSQRECAEALGQLDEHGLPFAAPVRQRARDRERVAALIMPG